MLNPVSIGHSAINDQNIIIDLSKNLLVEGPCRNGVLNRIAETCKGGLIWVGTDASRPDFHFPILDLENGSTASFNPFKNGNYDDICELLNEITARPEENNSPAAFFRTRAIDLLYAVAEVLCELWNIGCLRAHGSDEKLSKITPELFLSWLPVCPNLVYDSDMAKTAAKRLRRMTINHLKAALLDLMYCRADTVSHKWSKQLGLVLDAILALRPIADSLASCSCEVDMERCVLSHEPFFIRLPVKNRALAGSFMAQAIVNVLKRLPKTVESAVPYPCVVILDGYQDYPWAHIGGWLERIKSIGGVFVIGMDSLDDLSGKRREKIARVKFRVKTESDGRFTVSDSASQP